MKTVWLFFACVAVVTVSLSQADEETKEDFERNIKREQKFLFKHFSTRTKVSLSTIITTVPVTCIIAANYVNAVACKRKQRRKRNFRHVRHMDNEEDDLSLHSSSNQDVDPVPSDSKSIKRSGRLKITFWSSTTSYFTLTSTSTNTASTFSVSFFCSIAGFPFPPVCGR